MLVNSANELYLRNKSVSPLNITQLSLQDATVKTKSNEGIIGVKPIICDNEVNVAKYGTNFNTVLAPLTNQLYKYNIRNKYINYISNDSGRERNKDENGALLIDKPSLEETIDFSSIYKRNYTIIGLLSSWIDLGTTDPIINMISFSIITNELMIAYYNQISNVILSPPKNVSNIANYCEILIKLLSYIKQNSLNITISISLPIITTEDLDYLSTWELWLKIKTLCNHDPHLNISLALLQTYSSGNLDFLNKWVFEPVGSLLLSSSIFLPNKFKQPVLNKLNQLIIKKFMLQKENNIKILLHGLEKHSDNESTYIDYMNYITQKITKDLPSDTSSLGKNKEHLYLELHYHIEERLKAKLDELLNLKQESIHILLVKPDPEGFIIKTVLKNILEKNKNEKSCSFIITVMEDNFINLNKITFFNNDKWGSILNIVDSLNKISKNLDIVVSDNIQEININQYFDDIKLLPYDVENKTEYIPEEILFKLKPVFKQQAITKPLLLPVNECNYLSLTREKEYDNGQSLIYKINKKQQYNGIVLTLTYRIGGKDIKIIKYVLPVDYHYLCKDTELEFNISITPTTKSSNKATEIHYTSSCYIYFINDQYAAIPDNHKQRLHNKEGEGPMFDISSAAESHLEFHERCMLWCEKLYKVVI